MGSGLAFHTRSVYHPAMSGPLRIEFPSAVYHVTLRGDRREPIHSEDGSMGIEILTRAMGRFDVHVLRERLVTKVDELSTCTRVLEDKIRTYRKMIASSRAPTRKATK